MNTPICDFCRRYAEEAPLRLHMPGHKGLPLLGFEERDLTEVRGADSLYEAMRRFMQLDADARRAMGLAGREHVAEKFDKKKVVEATMEALGV